MALAAEGAANGPIFESPFCVGAVSRNLDDRSVDERLLGTQGAAADVSLYVAGLIRPRERKSVGPMAEPVAPVRYGPVAHFVSDEATLERELAIQADKLIDGSDLFLVIGDTALPKKGTHSGGVAPQYASALGKTANCQTPLVSRVLARGEVPVMVGLRLFLLESWTSDPFRLDRAGVPRTIARRGGSQRDRSGRTRPAGRWWGSLWRHSRRRWRWHERRVPPGLERASDRLGGRRSGSPESLPARRRTPLPCRRAGPPRKRHLPDISSKSETLVNEKGAWSRGATEPKAS